LEQCASWGMAFLPWYPLAASQLTRAGNRLAEVASGHGATPGQLALAARPAGAGVAACSVARDAADPGHLVG